VLEIQNPANFFLIMTWKTTRKCEYLTGMTYTQGVHKQLLNNHEMIKLCRRVAGDFREKRDYFTPPPRPDRCQTKAYCRRQMKRQSFITNENTHYI